MKTIEIKNVHVFDGLKLSELKSVVIENGAISSKLEGEIEYDGQGGTLLPGLFDCHTHVEKITELQQAAHYGVTTMLDLAAPSKEIFDSLINLKDLPTLKGCYLPAMAEGAHIVKRMGFPESSMVINEEDAERFVIEQILNGAYVIKIRIDDPKTSKDATLTPEIIKAIVDASHKYNKLAFAHVTTIDTFKIAIEAGIDVLNHTPLNAALPKELITQIKEKNIVTIPTMIMMKGIESNLKNSLAAKFLDFHNVVISVKALKEANAIIIAGTDANDSVGTVNAVKHGESLHTELELLVSTGLTPLEALQSATAIPAELFGFEDRGAIEVGKRADLVLVEGNPLEDISMTKNIKAVWINGVQVR